MKTATEILFDPTIYGHSLVKPVLWYGRHVSQIFTAPLPDTSCRAMVDVLARSVFFVALAVFSISLCLLGPIALAGWAIKYCSQPSEPKTSPESPKILLFDPLSPLPIPKSPEPKTSPESPKILPSDPLSPLPIPKSPEPKTSPESPKILPSDSLSPLPIPKLPEPKTSPESPKILPSDSLSPLPIPKLPEPKTSPESPKILPSDSLSPLPIPKSPEPKTSPESPKTLSSDPLSPLPFPITPKKSQSPEPKISLTPLPPSFFSLEWETIESAQKMAKELKNIYNKLKILNGPDTQRLLNGIAEFRFLYENYHDLDSNIQKSFSIVEEIAANMSGIQLALEHWSNFYRMKADDQGIIPQPKDGNCWLHTSILGLQHSNLLNNDETHITLRAKVIEWMREQSRNDETLHRFIRDAINNHTAAKILEENEQKESVAVAIMAGYIPAEKIQAAQSNLKAYEKSLEDLQKFTKVRMIQESIGSFKESVIKNSISTQEIFSTLQEYEKSLKDLQTVLLQRKFEANQTDGVNAAQLASSEEAHPTLEKCEELLENVQHLLFEDYFDHMRKIGSHGGHAELYAISRMFKVNIAIWRDIPAWENLPNRLTKEYDEQIEHPLAQHTINAVLTQEGNHFNYLWLSQIGENSGI